VTQLLLSLMSAAVTVCACLALLLCSLLLLQVVMARRQRALPPVELPRPRIGVLMPAHDEASGIASPIHSVLAQLRPGDRLIVIADNCNDATAQVARDAGAEVAERTDAVRRGKGYALDFGVRALEADPPEIVLIVDADCEIHPLSLDRLTAACAASGCPTQALYLMRSPVGSGLKTRIAEFAWAVKNHARALGFMNLGLPCQLMGSGMAFPWKVIRDAPLASGHIVEDLQLGLDLAAAGTPPRFCPEALVTSFFPASSEGMMAQRTRWEHGHLGIAFSLGPRMLWRALRLGRLGMAAMALDVCVPPLASLVIAMTVGLAFGIALQIAGFASSLIVLAGAWSALLLAIALAWRRFGRDVVSLRDLLFVPVYVAAKLPLYVRAVSRRQMEWVRTKRDDHGP
jgi:cellulose synthase/poly-beta-1,6-N-acetylglucosamine synthase-like glycosyltransferase